MRSSSERGGQLEVDRGHRVVGVVQRDVLGGRDGLVGLRLRLRHVGGRRRRVHVLCVEAAEAAHESTE